MRTLVGWLLKLAVPAAGAAYVASSDNPAAQYVREMLEAGGRDAHPGGGVPLIQGA